MIGGIATVNPRFPEFGASVPVVVAPGRRKERFRNAIAQKHLVGFEASNLWKRSKGRSKDSSEGASHSLPQYLANVAL